MKIISRVLLLTLGMIVVLTGKVWAETGSLKINVDVPVTPQVTEKTYFEQDVLLKQLFDASLSQMISKQQAEESLSGTEDNALLFLSTSPQKLNPIDTTQFFLTQSTASPSKGVTLRPPQKESVWFMIAFIGLGFLVSGVSVYQFLKKRKTHHA